MTWDREKCFLIIEQLVNIYQNAFLLDNRIKYILECKTIVEAELEKQSLNAVMRGLARKSQILKDDHYNYLANANRGNVDIVSQIRSNQYQIRNTDAEAQYEKIELAMIALMSNVLIRSNDLRKHIRMI